MKFIKYLAWIIIALFLLVPTIMWSLVATTSGSVWLINQAVKFTDYQFSYTAIEGDLLSELRIIDGKITHDSLRVEAAYIEVAWLPAELIDKKLIFKKVVGENINIWFKSASAPQPETTNIVLPNMSLPLELRIEQLRTRNIAIATNGTAQSLPDINASFVWLKQKLELKRLELSHQSILATIKGQVTTADNYPVNLNVNWSVTEPLPNIEIDNIIGNGRVVGDTLSLTINTEFSVANTSEVQRANIAIKDALTSPKWLAKVNLDAFQIRPLLPLAFSVDSNWYTYLQNASVNLEATIDQQQIVIEQLTTQAIDGQNGRLRASGSMTNYLQISSIPDSVTFKVLASGTDIQLPEQWLGSNARIDTFLANIEGGLSDFSHSISLTANYDQFDEVNLTSQGSGSTKHMAIDQATINSQNLTASLSAQSSWEEALSVHVNIAQLTAVVPQLEHYENNIVTAGGSISYVGEQIRADDFVINWADNRVSLFGSMRSNDPLVVTLQMPKLESLALNDYLLGSLNAKFALSGTLDQEVQIAIDELVFDHPDFGKWQSDNQGQLTIPIATPLAFAADDICLTSTSRRATSTVCARTATSGDIQTTTVEGSALPLALANRFRNETVAERIWGLANLEAEFRYSLTNLELINTKGRLHSEQTVLFALDEEVSTRLAYWEVDWNGNTDNITGSLIAELENGEGTLLGELTVTDPMNTAELKGEILLDVSDLTILQWVLPDLRYENAQAVGSISIAGNKVAPQITGSVELAAQEVGFAQTGLVLTNVRIAAFDNTDLTDTISLTGQAESGEGWISINGDIQPLVPALNLNINGDNFRALQLPTATIDISPDINIKLADKRIDISGEVAVPYALIDQPEIQQTAITPSNDVRVYENGERVESEPTSAYPLYANVRLTLGDQVKVSAFGFDGQLGGSIRVIEAPNRALTATGSIQVKEGFYELYGQRLEIDRGSLIYSGGPINNPGLDLRASRAKENLLTTENISVGAQVNGTLQEPEFRLYSTPAMPDSEVLSYLILGRGSGASTGGNENLQLQALILLGSKGTDILGESLQETFGLDEFGIDSTMNPNDTSFYIGKYLSPKLYVKYGVGLFENTNTFLVRYLLSEHFIIETTASSEAQGGDIFYTIEK